MLPRKCDPCRMPAVTSGFRSGSPQGAARSPIRPAVRPGQLMAPDITIVVALQEPIMALGARTALEGVPGFRVLACVSTAAEVEPCVARLSPQVLLMDAHFQQGADGSILPLLAEKHRECKVLVMVDHGDDECTVRALMANGRTFRLTEDALQRLRECCLTALRSAARGCIPKCASLETLVDAVRTVAMGEYWTGPGLTAAWIEEIRSGLSVAVSPTSLSPREIEIIGLVVEGLANKEIASRLGLSEQTVKNQVSRIMAKLGLNCRTELALYAVRARLA